MRILVLGDFSGRQNRRLAGPGAGLSGRSILAVDVDNFEEVLKRLSPRLALEWGDGSSQAVSLELGSLDGYHPDALYQSLEVFRALREIRRQLLEPAPAGAGTVPTRREILPAAGAEGREDDSATLERLLGRAPGAAKGSAVDITEFLRRIVGPYIVPKGDPRLPALVAAVDEAATGQMRAILHHPAFQALESAWRGLHWLATGLETGEDLKLYVLDVTREELEADIRAAGSDLKGSGLFRLLVDDGSGMEGSSSWSLLVGSYTFGSDPRDVEVLGALGAIAAHAGGPFLAGADPRILGCRSFIEAPDPRDWIQDDAEAQRAWRALRGSPMARWLGLALPRLLLRLPYGRGIDEVERFAFEELASADEHEAFLWGNSAFACALLIGRAFLERGGHFEPGDLLDVGDLPAHAYVKAGERRLTPCAEVFLTERAADAIIARGLMPLVSLRATNAARLVRFQSLADPPAALSGPWS